MFENIFAKQRQRPKTKAELEVERVNLDAELTFQNERFANAVNRINVTGELIEMTKDTGNSASITRLQGDIDYNVALIRIAELEQNEAEVSRLQTENELKRQEIAAIESTMLEARKALAEKYRVPLEEIEPI